MHRGIERKGSREIHDTATDNGVMERPSRMMESEMKKKIVRPQRGFDPRHLGNNAKGHRVSCRLQHARPQRDSNPRLLDIIMPDWIKGCDHRTVWVAACRKATREMKA
ncbi:hypothetical protein B0H13DRAFT_1862876 [Mycena leptocephala]|nr:hypothetical protein B0H13DRAFT_1862876 [Mycena leptocephala]